jgi:hypothetical protein
MLNKRKKIQLKQKESMNSSLFFNLPEIPRSSFLQTNSTDDILTGLKLIFQTQKLNEEGLNQFRFSFSSNDFRSYSLLTKHKNRYCQKKENFVGSLTFVKRLLQTHKRHRFFILKQIKGGFLTTSFGFVIFMPQSLRVKTKKRLQFLLRLKILKRKQRFSLKRRVKINLVGSSKKRKTSVPSKTQHFFSKKINQNR